MSRGDEELWTQKMAGEFIRVSLATLRLLGPPRIAVRKPGVKVPLVRYIPSRLRDWITLPASQGGCNANREVPLRAWTMKMPPIPTDEPLWKQQEAAAFVGITPNTLRASSCPKILLGLGGGKNPLIRYVPSQVRDWVQASSTMRRA